MMPIPPLWISIKTKPVTRHRFIFLYFYLSFSPCFSRSLPLIWKANQTDDDQQFATNSIQSNNNWVTKCTFNTELVRLNQFTKQIITQIQIQGTIRINKCIFNAFLDLSKLLYHSFWFTTLTLAPLQNWKPWRVSLIPEYLFSSRHLLSQLGATRFFGRFSLSTNKMVLYVVRLFYLFVTFLKFSHLFNIKTCEIQTRICDLTTDLEKSLWQNLEPGINLRNCICLVTSRSLHIKYNLSRVLNLIFYFDCSCV